MIGVDSAGCRRALAHLGADLAEAAVKTVAAAVKAAADDARATTLYHDRTGTLRGKTTGVANGVEGVVTADTAYAAYVDSSRPFMEHARDVGDKIADYGIEVYLNAAISAFNY